MHQWNEDTVVAPHLNTQATAMSLNVSGQLVLLASRRNLTLIDLNNPKNVLRRINLTNKWDISRAAWNPFTSNQHYFLTTYNQWTDLWHCGEANGTKISTFCGHTRAISDVDWSSVDANLMATCSLDTYIYLWDIRETKKAKLVTSTVSGASCVRWNKIDRNILASSHDGNIRLWDIRNGKTPVQYITAHISKINCLDWSATSQYELCSASQDSNISFWDTTVAPRVAKFHIYHQHPVWRAEYTPFGSAMSSVTFKNFRETPFNLWNINDVQRPVHVYNGHGDVVLDFHWRRKADQSWQLVTWCKDLILRLWTPDINHLIVCGVTEEDNADIADDEERASCDVDICEKDPSSLSSAGTHVSDSLRLNAISPDLSVTSDRGTLGSSPSSSTTLKPRASYSPHNLEQEFKLLNVNLPNLTMNQMDKGRRLCAVTLRTATQFLTLHITFPFLYPQNEAPIFEFTSWSENIEDDTRGKLLQILRETALHLVKNSRSCLEPCLRRLAQEFRAMSYNNDKIGVGSSLSNSPFLYGFGAHPRHHNDLYKIPFPRTSGARFCSAGYLVVFLRPTHVKGFHSNLEKTPKTFPSLPTHRKSIPGLQHVGFDNAELPSSAPNLRVSAFYYKEKRSSRKSLKHCYNPVNKDNDGTDASVSMDTKQSRLHQVVGRVVVIDLTRIMPVSKKLACQYIIPEHHNFMKACQHNKEKALSEDMSDLVQLWSCVAFLPEPGPQHNELSPIFQSSPLGRTFLSNLLSHYSTLKDVQTLAMLSCTFGSVPKSPAESDIPAERHVKRSISHQNFPSMTDGDFGLRKSPSDAKFPENPSRTSWWNNVMARSPTNEISKFLRNPTGSPPDDFRFEETEFFVPEPTKQERWSSECRMLDPGREAQYNAFKTSYSSLLERWKMSVKVAEMMKVATAPIPSSNLDFRRLCPTCKDVCSCMASTNTIRCVICQLPVKEAWSFCASCFHGGHLEHMSAWFETRKMCPSATNCKCLCSARQIHGLVPVGCDMSSQPGQE